MPKKKRASGTVRRAAPKTASRRATKRAAPPRKKGSADSGGSKRKTRVGLPAAEDVVGEEKLETPSGKVYRILKTNERDEYDTGKPT